MKYPQLFSPISSQRVYIPESYPDDSSRDAARWRRWACDKNIKDSYRAFAMGGLGSIVVEAAVVLPSRSSFNLRISDDQFIDQLRDFHTGHEKGNTLM